MRKKKKADIHSKKKKYYPEYKTIKRIHLDFFSLIKVIYIIVFILLSEKTIAFSDRINGMRKGDKS